MTSGTDAEAAYDIWLNNWNNEVMIQNDFEALAAQVFHYRIHRDVRRLGWCPCAELEPVHVRLGNYLAVG